MRGVTSWKAAAGIAFLLPQSSAFGEEPAAAVTSPVPVAEAKPEREPSVELGLFLGGQTFHSSTAPMSRNGPSFGMRAGVHVRRWLAIETELGFSPTTAAGDDVLQFAWRAHVLAYLPPSGLRQRTFRPFFIVGLGGLTTGKSAATVEDQELQIPLSGSETDFVIDAGMGVTYARAETYGFRLEARAIVAPLQSDKFDTPDFEVLVGVYRRIGGWSERSAVAAKAPVEESPTHDTPVDAPPSEEVAAPDSDGDQVLDSADKCLDRAEDRDNYEDDDGCPEADNDSDGIADVGDRCPNDAETKNGLTDEDGCPDEMPAAVIAALAAASAAKFDANSARLTPKVKAALDKAVMAILGNRDLKFVITVHPEKSGDKDAALAKRRADNVKAHLVEQGAAIDTLSTAVGDVVNDKSAPVVVISVAL
jgi:outer membrane protein OmpA-like peptidoglycan-associated protein